MARLQVVLAAVCFGTTGTAQALGPSIEPAAVGAARIVVGGALLAVIALLAAHARPRPGGLQVRASAGIVLLAGACVAVYQLTFFVAVADTGVAVGTVVAIGSAPAFAGLFDRLSGGSALDARWAGATALACCGVVLLTLGGGAGAQVSAVGVGLAAIAGAGYAAYAVASKRLLERGYTPETTMAAVFGTGALLVAPALLLVPAGGLLAPGGIALALYLGVVPTAVAYVLFARGLRRLPAGETATLTLAEPLTAASLGVLALGERPSIATAVGGALVLTGLVLVALRPAVRRPTEADPRHLAAELAGEPRHVLPEPA